MDDAEIRRQLEQHHFASYGWELSCCARDAAVAEDVLQTVYLKVRLSAESRHLEVKFAALCRGAATPQNKILRSFVVKFPAT